MTFARKKVSFCLLAGIAIGAVTLAAVPNVADAGPVARNSLRGAGAGAIVGGIAGGGQGAAIGAAAGAATGAVVGKVRKDRRRRDYVERHGRRR